MLLDKAPGLVILLGRNADRAGTPADRTVEHIARTVPRAVVAGAVTVGLAALAVVFAQRAGTQVAEGGEAGLGLVPGAFQFIDVRHDRLREVGVWPGSQGATTGRKYIPDGKQKSIHCRPLGQIVTILSCTPWFSVV